MRILLTVTAALTVALSSAGTAAASAVAVCPAVPAKKHFTCYALVLKVPQPKPSSRHKHPAPHGGANLVTGAVNPSGYHPANLQAAYGLLAVAAKAGGTQTVAVVDAYDDPNAAADLATYRSAFGLPACATGCFTKVNETGGSTPPAPSASWAQEVSLDLEMVSAVCPNCKILLVEAKSTSFTDFFTAESYAIARATEVSNSWGGPEFHGENAYDVYLEKPIPITFSSGDNGYGVQYPAASPYVTAVGGTTLSSSGGARGYSETAWSGSASGCSAYEPKPAWQKDTGCATRTVVDVSADANPKTGVAVYDSYQEPGWMVFGGTSAAAPIIAGTYALAGGFKTALYGSALYSHSSSLFAVVGGSTGTCKITYLCTALGGYNGPTGLGTPDGIGAF